MRECKLLLKQSKQELLSVTVPLEQGGASSGKLVPTLSVSDNGDDTGTITYNGDGTLTAYCCYRNDNTGLHEIPISTYNNQLKVDGGYNNIREMLGIIVASEGEEYSPAWSTFTITGSGPI